MSYFPAFIDLQEEKKILIVGGGKTALHKVKVLLPFNVSIDVVEIFMNEELVELGKKEEKLTLYKKSFYDEMISPDVYHLVIAATNNRVVNHRISTLCKAEKLLVNVVDDPEECTFIFPSIVKRGDIICGISSSGTCPPVTQYIKEKLYDLLPDNIGDITEHLGILREQMKEDIPDHKQRSAALKNELEKELSASKILRIGTRGSALALRQTNIIIDRIKQDYPDMDIEVVKISTKGDRATDRATMLNLMVGLNGYTLCSGILCETLNGSNYCAVKLDQEELMSIVYIVRKGIEISPLGKKYLEEIRKFQNSGLK